MSNITHKIFTDKMGATTASEYIGKEGDVFYDTDGTSSIRLANGVTPGGIPFAVLPTNDTFNPQFTDASGTFSIGGGSQTASYIRHGSICHFRVNVQFSPSTNYGIDQYQITLPFPAVSTTSIRGGTLHMKTGNGAPAKYHIAGILDIEENVNILKLYYYGTTTDLEWAHNTPHNGFWATSGSQNAHFDINGAYHLE